jgi:hypothetical protein
MIMTHVSIALAPGSLCPLSHNCAVCGAVALFPLHGTRGRTWERTGLSKCPANFLVRCAECSRLNRRKAGQIYAIDHSPKTWEELEEFEKQQNVVYEIM